MVLRTGALLVLAACEGLPDQADTGPRAPNIIPTYIDADSIDMSCADGVWQPSVNVFGAFVPDHLLISAVETAEWISPPRARIGENHFLPYGWRSQSDAFHRYEGTVLGGSYLEDERTAISCSRVEPSHAAGFTYIVRAYTERGALEDCVIVGHNPEGVRRDYARWVVTTDPPYDYEDIQDCRIRLD